MIYFSKMYKNKKSQKEPRGNSVYFPYGIIAN